MLRAVMSADGPAVMTRDAELAVGEEPAWSPWRDSALYLLAEARLLTGDLEEAMTLLAESASLGAQLGNTDTVVAGGSELALLLMDGSRWDEATGSLAPALAAIEEYRMDDYVVSGLAFAAAARLALHRGDLDETNRQLTRAMRTRPTCTYVLPWLAVRLRLQLAKMYLAASDATTAHHLMREIDDILLRRPNLGTLTEDVLTFRASLPSSGPTETNAGPPLSPAELRVLPYLQTHLTLPEIAGRLFVSHHTVRSQVGSIYRKFGVSSRSEAVQHATGVGLLGG
jgi:LuxR family maltose regulon positive regulatory protein